MALSQSVARSITYLPENPFNNSTIREFNLQQP